MRVTVQVGVAVQNNAYNGKCSNTPLFIRCLKPGSAVDITECALEVTPILDLIVAG